MTTTTPTMSSDQAPTSWTEGLPSWEDLKKDAADLIDEGVSAVRAEVKESAPEFYALAAATYHDAKATMQIVDQSLEARGVLPTLWDASRPARRQLIDHVAKPILGERLTNTLEKSAEAFVNSREGQGVSSAQSVLAQEYASEILSAEKFVADLEKVATPQEYSLSGLKEALTNGAQYLYDNSLGGAEFQNDAVQSALSSVAREIDTQSAPLFVAQAAVNLKNEMQSERDLPFSAVDVNPEDFTQFQTAFAPESLTFKLTDSALAEVSDFQENAISNSLAIVHHGVQTSQGEAATVLQTTESKNILSLPVLAGAENNNGANQLQLTHSVIVTPAQDIEFIASLPVMQYLNAVADTIAEGVVESASIAEPMKIPLLSLGARVLYFTSNPASPLGLTTREESILRSLILTKATKESPGKVLRQSSSAVLAKETLRGDIIPVAGHDSIFGAQEFMANDVKQNLVSAGNKSKSSQLHIAPIFTSILFCGQNGTSVKNSPETLVFLHSGLMTFSKNDRSGNVQDNVEHELATIEYERHLYTVSQKDDCESSMGQEPSESDAVAQHVDLDDETETHSLDDLFVNSDTEIFIPAARDVMVS